MFERMNAVSLRKAVVTWINDLTGCGTVKFNDGLKPDVGFFSPSMISKNTVVQFKRGDHVLVGTNPGIEAPACVISIEPGVD